MVLLAESPSLSSDSVSLLSCLRVFLAMFSATSLTSAATSGIQQISKRLGLVTQCNAVCGVVHMGSLTSSTHQPHHFLIAMPMPHHRLISAKQRSVHEDTEYVDDAGKRPTLDQDLI